MDNATMLLIPDALEVGVTDSLFWASLAWSLVEAFAVTVPINRRFLPMVAGMPWRMPVIDAV